MERLDGGYEILSELLLNEGTRKAAVKVKFSKQFSEQLCEDY